MLSLLTSCDNMLDEEPLIEESPVPICFEVSEYLSTKAPVTGIDATNVSNVGIYGVTEGSTSNQYPWTASPFVSNIIPSGISQGQLTFSPKLYYPGGGKKVVFYAYYPYTNVTTTTSNSYITPPGNGTAPVYNFTLSDQQDVMHAVSAPSNSSNSSPIPLQYNHKLSQIIVNTSILTGILRSAKLVAVPNKGSLNLETGNVTWGSGTADINVTIPLLGGLSDPVFVPANATSYKLQVTLLFTTTYTLTPSNGTFTPGVAYTITLK